MSPLLAEEALHLGLLLGVRDRQAGARRRGASRSPTA